MGVAERGGSRGGLSLRLSFDAAGQLEVPGRGGDVLLHISPASTMFTAHTPSYLCGVVVSLDALLIASPKYFVACVTPPSFDPNCSEGGSRPKQRPRLHSGSSKGVGVGVPRAVPRNKRNKGGLADCTTVVVGAHV